MNSTEVPDHWAISYTDKLAAYMVARFRTALLPTDATLPKEIPNPQIPMQTVCEANRMVGIMARAYRNKGMVPTYIRSYPTNCHPVTISDVDIIRLGERMKRGANSSMPSDADTQAYGDLTEPAVITDRTGYVLLWYLPGAISEPNQVSVSQSSRTISLMDRARNISGNSCHCCPRLFPPASRGNLSTGEPLRPTSTRPQSCEGRSTYPRLGFNRVEMSAFTAITRPY
jgi:hypothetical protein